MKRIHYTEITPRLFDGDTVKGVQGRVLIGKEDGAENFCMRIFSVDPGGFSPKHSHGWEHEIFVHSGHGAALSGDEWLPVSAGTALFIPGDREHQLKNTGDTPLVFVCLIPSGAPEL
jgi:quercetin dioxygenase-like cupin family protein